MARDDRIFLEGIAVDMLLGRTKYVRPEAMAEALEQVKALADADLISCICDGGTGK